MQLLPGGAGIKDGKALSSGGRGWGAGAAGAVEPQGEQGLLGLHRLEPARTQPLVTVWSWLHVGVPQPLPLQGLSSGWRASSLPTELLVQVDLLEMQVQLYNATAKLPWSARGHPARPVEGSAEEAAALAPLKPGQRKQLTPSPVAGFLATRSFHWKEDPSQEQGPTVLLLGSTA